MAEPKEQNMDELMEKGEETNLNESQLLFVKDLENKLEALFGETTRDKIAFYLHPNESDTQIINTIRNCVKEHQICKTDYLALKQADPEICDFCTLALDLIPDVDTEVVQMAIKNGSIGPILHIYEKLDPTKVDPKETYSQIIEYRNKQNKYHTDLEKIDALIVGSCEKFPDVTKKSLRKDMDAGETLQYGRYIRSQLENARLDGTEVDLHNLKEAFVYDFPDRAIHFIKNIKGITTEDIDTIAKEAYSPFSSIEQYGDYIPRKDLRQRFLDYPPVRQELTMSEMIGLGRYEAINIFNSCFEQNEFKKERAMMVEALSKQFEEALKQGNPNQCAEIAKCVQNLDPTIKTGLWTELIEQQLANTEKPVTVEKYTSKNVTKDATLFYLYDWANYKMMQIEYQLKPHEKQQSGLVEEPKEFSRVEDRKKYIEAQTVLKNNREAQVSETFDWIKKYLIVATNSETAYQSQEDRLSGDFVKPIDIFVEPFTSEELRINLSKWQPTPDIGKRGIAKEDLPSIAGYKWSVIAKIGIRSWSAKPLSIGEQAAVIDNALDAEHYGGNIFDKDPHFIERDKLTKILDIKQKAQNEKELLIYAKENSLLTSEQLKFFNDLFETIDNLSQAPKKAAGYE